MQASSPFHATEVAIQEKLGIAERLHQQVSGFIRHEMPQQHQDFYQSLPMAIMGCVDILGEVWALPVFGEVGFIQATSNTTLQFNNLPILHKELALDFDYGQKLGMLGIELSTRRRNRVNGTVNKLEDNGFTLHVDQSYGNCPQYIHKREFNLDSAKLNVMNVKMEFQPTQITNAIARTIENADTFFIASRSKNFNADPRSGIDASHRGGKKGFVTVDGKYLKFPDFAGNKFFNTLGNIEEDGRVGLFFPDFENGHGILIRGHAKVLWDPKLLPEFAGAERFVEIECLEAIYIKHCIPIATSLLEYSPSVKRTGEWS